MKMPSSSDRPISEQELHALVDGRLSADEAQRLRARLASDPASAHSAEAWRAQRELLSAHLRDTLAESIPDTLRAAADAAGRRRASTDRWQRWSAVAAGVVLAFGGGWLGHAQWEVHDAPAALASRSFARQALVAYAVYAPEVRHPVEVGAEQQAHLVQWLSKRVGRPLRVPQLQASGFELVGGRLLPGEGGARAQFMYQNAAGLRLTLYIGALSGAQEAGTAFRFASGDGASSFYWVDQGFGYALTGALPRERMLELARVVHAQL